MADWWSLVGPAGPTTGGVLRATIAALVTYFVVQKRKKIQFSIADTEDLTELLHERGKNRIKVSVDGRELDTLNRAEVLVRKQR